MILSPQHSVLGRVRSFALGLAGVFRFGFLGFRGFGFRLRRGSAIAFGFGLGLTLDSSVPVFRVVEPAPLQNESAPEPDQTPDFALSAGGALLVRLGMDRLKALILVLASLTGVFIGRHTDPIPENQVEDVKQRACQRYFMG